MCTSVRNTRSSHTRLVIRLNIHVTFIPPRTWTRMCSRESHGTPLGKTKPEIFYFSSGIRVNLRIIMSGWHLLEARARASPHRSNWKLPGHTCIALCHGCTYLLPVTSPPPWTMVQDHGPSSCSVSSWVQGACLSRITSIKVVSRRLPRKDWIFETFQASTLTNLATSLSENWKENWKTKEEIRKISKMLDSNGYYHIRVCVWLCVVVCVCVCVCARVWMYAQTNKYVWLFSAYSLDSKCLQKTINPR